MSGLKRPVLLVIILRAALLSVSVGVVQAPDPLPSWNEGKTKRSISDQPGRLFLGTRVEVISLFTVKLR